MPQNPTSSPSPNPLRDAPLRAPRKRGSLAILSKKSISSISGQNPANSLANLAPLVVLLTLLAAQPAAAANPLTPEQIAEGWINLFDGTTLYGWQPTSKADWKVEDGEIRVTSGEQGFLMTTSEFADYELHVEFKAPATTNSGIFLRTPLDPKDPAKDCIELNIAPKDNPNPTGSFVGRTVNDFGISGISRPPVAAWDGEWHRFDVRVGIKEGLDEKAHSDIQLISASLDDVPQHTLVLPMSDPSSPRRGRIGLQFREGEVAFRNIRLKPIGLAPMLNGKDLTGWNTDLKRDAKFDLKETSGSLPLAGRAGEGVEAGTRPEHPSLTLPVEGRGPEDLNMPSELHVTSGPGQLETNDSYGDFTVQLEAFVDGDGLNSGVFFRSIPRDFANGYECQINNGIKDNDPTKPVDAGTGAIYRRTTARRVVSKDHEWFAMTLIATGPHMAAWVNGEQVTDWTDERKPDPNPRKGLRLEPGTISLQAHDPTTNLRFKNLRIAEFPKAE